MIFASEKMAYDGKSYTSPLWQLDTDNYAVIHINEATGKEERTPFHNDCTRYHINYTVEHCPERFEKLVNSGEILEYLENFEDKIFEAVDKLTDHWKQTDKEYLLAKENSDTLKEVGLLNMFDMRAKEIVYRDMVYV